MEEELRIMVFADYAEPPYPNMLFEDVERFRAKHGLTLEGFCTEFAALVAIEFAAGHLSYWDADNAMNDLMAITKFEAGAFASEVFEAFDRGEFISKEEPVHRIPWQYYTLPEIMESLKREGLLKRLTSRLSAFRP